jgi:hypothetical protein
MPSWRVFPSDNKIKIDHMDKVISDHRVQRPTEGHKLSQSMMRHRSENPARDQSLVLCFDSMSVYGEGSDSQS